MADTGASAARAGRVALILTGLLALVSVLAIVGVERSTVGSWLGIGVLLAPLLLAAPGLLRRDRRTFAWATLCLTPHFVFALTELVANPAIRGLAAAMLLLALALVVALVAYLRLTRS